MAISRGPIQSLNAHSVLQSARTGPSHVETSAYVNDLAISDLYWEGTRPPARCSNAR